MPVIQKSRCRLQARGDRDGQTRTLERASCSIVEQEGRGDGFEAGDPELSGQALEALLPSLQAGPWRAKGQLHPPGEERSGGLPRRSGQGGSLECSVPHRLLLRADLRGEPGAQQQECHSE